MILACIAPLSPTVSRIIAIISRRLLFFILSKLLINLKNKNGAILRPIDIF
jgi:hypothetical protein